MSRHCHVVTDTIVTHSRDSAINMTSVGVRIVKSSRCEIISLSPVMRLPMCHQSPVYCPHVSHGARCWQFSISKNSVSCRLLFTYTCSSLRSALKFAFFSIYSICLVLSKSECSTNQWLSLLRCWRCVVSVNHLLVSILTRDTVHLLARCVSLLNIITDLCDCNEVMSRQSLCPETRHGVIVL